MSNINSLEINRNVTQNTLKITWGLKHKRLILNRGLPTIERIKYVALEGTSVTLIGLFKYDLETGSTQLTELSHILSGGIKEAIRCLDKHREFFETIGIDMFFMSLQIFIFASYF